MIPRGPLSTLPGERIEAGIGHNQGPPLDPARQWRSYAWGRARKALLPRLPLEVIRRRVARATELGLAYPDYAAILLGTGRDIVAFLFTSDALGVGQAAHLPGPVAEKLGALQACDRLLMARPGEDAAALATRIAAAHRVRFATSGPAPVGGRRPDGREAIRSILDPLHLPGDAVVMVGTAPVERDWAEAARLARFLSAARYFSEPSQASR